MLPLKQRIAPFVLLGTNLRSLGLQEPWPGFDSGLSEDEYNDLANHLIIAEQHNPWFTQENIRFALKEWGSLLTEDQLTEWIAKYDLKDEREVRDVGIIMAGNIPMVGFHDILSVLVAGHRAHVKLSSDDNVLLKAVISALTVIEPQFDERITLVEKLESFDAVIATGSNNTNRYFEYYFRSKPSLLRRNRTSVAVLTGEESDEDLKALAEDVFRYFGLGCRNVSKLYIPELMDLDRLFGAFFEYGQIANHNKWANNYDYHKAIYLMNGDNILENGFLLMKEDEGLHSPLSTLFYERYTDIGDVTAKIQKQDDEIQCVVGWNGLSFGEAQRPKLDDYADGADTIEFLCSLRTQGKSPEVNV